MSCVSKFKGRFGFCFISCTYTHETRITNFIVIDEMILWLHFVNTPASQTTPLIGRYVFFIDIVFCLRTGFLCFISSRHNLVKVPAYIQNNKLEIQAYFNKTINNVFYHYFVLNIPYYTETHCK